MNATKYEGEKRERREDNTENIIRDYWNDKTYAELSYKTLVGGLGGSGKYLIILNYLVFLRFI